jgi:S-DNA-T family DNA segregation ATPase FtsK/SpoIIIE
MGRKKKKDKKKDKVEGGDLLGLSQETKNSIYGILMFMLAILATLSFFDLAGTAGSYFKSISYTLFGWGFFLIPFAFIIVGVAFIKSVSHRIQRSAVWGTLLFVLGFLGIFYILGEGDTAARILQGGYLGLVLGYPTLKFIGFWASLVALIFICFVSLMAALDVPIYELIRRGISRSEDEKEEEEELPPVADKPALEKLVIRTGGNVVGDEAKAKKPVSKDEPDFVIKTTKSGKWKLPPLNVLASDSEQPKAGDINSNAAIIKRTLADFNINVEMGEVSVGPTVTQYTFRPAVGVKLSKITTLRSDLALALAAHPIRIEAPIPGKSLVGIEVPNNKKATVGLGDLLGAEDYRNSKSFMPLAIGRDVAGYGVYANLERMPHLLIAGATGTGKSVCINTIILSMLYKHSPDILKFIFIDPKRVELTLYNGIPHLITPVITEPKKAIAALRWAVSEMERRYETLQNSGSRDVFSYNSKQSMRKDNVMPFLVIVIDELADLMAAYGRDIEGAIVRLAQMARAVGIHLVVSTQRPSVEVITGLIKANITTRIAFQVGSQVDSRTILDSSGAEQLLGNGDMLFQQGDASKPRRLQGAFVSEKEAKQVVKFVKDQADEVMEEEEEEEMQIDLESQPAGGGPSDGVDDDELYGDAKEVVIVAGKASASLLQRRLRVGYARAARLIDILEERGVIGPGEGAKPREVYLKPDVRAEEEV